MRNLIEWTNELSVGIQEIDEQHKILVDLLNRLHEAIITRHEKDVIGGILSELIQYTIVHFAVEESLMRIFDYPDYEEHKRHHAELTGEVFKFQEKISKGELTAENSGASMELWKFLRKWLTEHILVDDKKYSPFLLQRGLKASWSKKSSWIGKKIWGN